MKISQYSIYPSAEQMKKLFVQINEDYYDFYYGFIKEE